MSGLKRVAIVVPSLVEGGGVPAVARFLYRVLQESDGYEPFLVSLAMSSRDTSSLRALNLQSWFDGVRARRGTWEGRPYVHIGARVSEVEFMRYAPRRILTEVLERADLVQVVAGAPCWVLPAAKVSVPVFLHVATLTARERSLRHRVEKGPLAVWRRAMTRVTDRLDRAGLRRADRVFTMNTWMQRQAEEVLGPARVVLAPPGVDTGRFCPRDPAKPGLTEAYILSVGRFGDPRKNVDLLFRAYGMLKEREASTPQLWLAGPSGPPTSSWRMAAEHGIGDDIRYLGLTSEAELPRLYRNALFFVLSSDEEGFGLVLVEAMASGLPVVSTDSAGPTDIVSHGNDGFLTRVGDAEALAEAMALLVTRPRLRHEMGTRARSTAAGRFSESMAGARFLREYDSALGLRTSRPHTHTRSNALNFDRNQRA